MTEKYTNLEKGIVNYIYKEETENALKTVRKVTKNNNKKTWKKVNEFSAKRKS